METIFRERIVIYQLMDSNSTAVGKLPSLQNRPSNNY